MNGIPEQKPKGIVRLREAGNGTLDNLVGWF